MERWLKIFACALTAALAWVAAGTIRERIVEAGDTAPHFSIRTDRGKTVTPSSFGGRLLVLNFWATWCPPCLEELPSLDRFQAELRREGVVVLGISVDTNEQQYRGLVDRFQPSFETARDPSADIAASYGTFKYPETYIIDRSGRVVLKVISSRDWMEPQFVARIRGML